MWNPLRAELDTVPPRRPPLPESSYIVCSTHRSGSGLLCRGLAATGIAGTPAEYFNPNQRVPLTRRWGCGDSLDEYAATLRARRTDAGGVFGTKLHWGQLEEIQAEALEHGSLVARPDPSLIERLLPGSRFVRIVRLDIDAQAVSLWTALQTGCWSLRSGAPAPPAGAVPYSYAGILRCRQEIVEGEVGWDRFFRRSAITPLEVVYEQLVAQYAAVVRDTLEGILPGRAAAAVVAPDSRRQAGQRSAELLARFSSEHRRHRLSAPRRARSALSAIRRRTRTS